MLGCSLMESPREKLHGQAKKHVFYKAPQGFPPGRCLNVCHETREMLSQKNKKKYRHCQKKMRFRFSSPAACRKCRTRVRRGAKSIVNEPETMFFGE